jgi:hypothetical protein
MRGDADDTANLARLSRENRAAVLAMRETEARQLAEMADVRKWSWERLVMPRNATRRHREMTSVALHPCGWPSNVGFDGQNTCGSLSTGGPGLRVEAYHAFHGRQHELSPVVWRDRWSYTGHFCDAHLPDEYWPAESLAEEVA